MQPPRDPNLPTTQILDDNEAARLAQPRSRPAAPSRRRRPASASILKRGFKSSLVQRARQRVRPSAIYSKQARDRRQRTSSSSPSTALSPSSRSPSLRCSSSSTAARAARAAATSNGRQPAAKRRSAPRRRPDDVTSSLLPPKRGSVRSRLSATLAPTRHTPARVRTFRTSDVDLGNIAAGTSSRFGYDGSELGVSPEVGTAQAPLVVYGRPEWKRGKKRKAKQREGGEEDKKQKVEAEGKVKVQVKDEVKVKKQEAQEQQQQQPPPQPKSRFSVPEDETPIALGAGSSSSVVARAAQALANAKPEMHVLHVRPKDDPERRARKSSAFPYSAKYSVHESKKRRETAARRKAKREAKKVRVKTLQEELQALPVFLRRAVQLKGESVANSSVPASVRQAMLHRLLVKSTQQHPELASRKAAPLYTKSLLLLEETLLRKSQSQSEYEAQCVQALDTLAKHGFKHLISSSMGR